jgi:hypothetical protein
VRTVVVRELIVSQLLAVLLVLTRNHVDAPLYSAYDDGVCIVAGTQWAAPRFPDCGFRVHLRGEL